MCCRENRFYFLGEGIARFYIMIEPIAEGREQMGTGSHSKPKELRFISIGGLNVYSPAMSDSRAAQKHPCPDCHFCQFCSDIRCQSCRGAEKGSACSAAGKSSDSEPVTLSEYNGAETKEND